MTVAIKKLSIIIPAYNESATLPLILGKIKAAVLPDGIEKEVIVVDDCSTDDTETAISRFIAANPEVTSKIARIRNVRIYEVGISYYGRTYAEGKKIRMKDGFRALYCILRYGLFK